MVDKIEQKFQKKGLKLTDQRRTIARVILESKEEYGESDHPDVDELYNRVLKIDPKISIATVYRTVKLFEEAGILTKHDFKTGKARYELNDDHNHLIDIKTGEIIEFVDDEINQLQQKIAEKYGYKLVDHKLELYGIKKNKWVVRFLNPLVCLLSKSRYQIYLFPSYMMHTVYPFFSDEERRSVSFNAFIDEEAAKF